MLSETNSTEAIRAAYEGKPFRLNHEYVGPNEKNLSGESYKFWTVERVSNNGPVQIKFGRIGTNGCVTNVGISVSDALNRRQKKLDKGYIFVSARAAGAKVIKEKPLISATLPYPFSAIRRIVATNLVKMFRALDANDNLIALIPEEVAASLVNEYTLA